jgi:hypothetical protein
MKARASSFTSSQLVRPNKRSSRIGSRPFHGAIAKHSCCLSSEIPSSPLTKGRDPFASLDILSWCCMFRVYITFLALLITPVCPTPAQVFSVAPDAPSSSQSPNGQAPSGAQQLGWGSNIQNARLARAAELALEHGDRALAVDTSGPSSGHNAEPQKPSCSGLLLRQSLRLQNVVVHRGLLLDSSMRRRTESFLICMRAA